MQAEIKGGLYSFELNEGPPMLPDDPNDCWINVIADIGPVDASGGDMFVFSVCTVERLRKILADGKPVFVGKALVIERFSWEVLQNEVQSIVSSVTGIDWDEIANQLHQYGDWEFFGHME
jgi:hypothetical protein